MKNKWIDEMNRAYIIYTIDSIKEDLGCSKEKAVKVLAELDSVKGIGLVEKIRRGLGKPDIIYVKNFTTLSVENEEKEPATPDKITEVGKTDFKKSEKPTSRSQKIELQEVGKTEFKRSEKPTSRSQKIELQEVGKTEFKKSEKPNSVGRENRLQEVGKTDSNYTNKNYITGHNEQYVEQEAWDEQVIIYEDYAWDCCNVCGADITNNVIEHEKAHALAYEGGGHHIEYGTRPVTTTVHHEAVYGTRWVQDSAAYDETVVDGYVCSCGARK